MLHETATSFTFMDFVIIGTIALSAIFGFARGLTREVLSIGGWLLAAFVTLYGNGLVKPLAHMCIENHPFIADVVALVGLFVVSLIIFSFIIRSLSDKVKASSLGGLDRSLGLLFGTGRGLLVLMVVFACAAYIWPKPESRPAFMQQARLMGSLNKCTAWVADLLPESVVGPKLRKSLQPEPSPSSEEIVQSLASPQATTLRKSGGHGYSAEDRQEIENMFAQGTNKEKRF